MKSLNVSSQKMALSVERNAISDTKFNPNVGVVMEVIHKP